MQITLRLKMNKEPELIWVYHSVARFPEVIRKCARACARGERYEILPQREVTGEKLPSVKELHISLTEENDKDIIEFFGLRGHISAGQFTKNILRSCISPTLFHQIYIDKKIVPAPKGYEPVRSQEPVTEVAPVIPKKKAVATETPKKPVVEKPVVKQVTPEPANNPETTNENSGFDMFDCLGGLLENY